MTRHCLKIACVLLSWGTICFVAARGGSDPLNSLTPKEKGDGWLLLYDGKSTEGWQTEGEAVSKDGVLTVGGKKLARIQTAAKFSNVKLAYDFRWTGKSQPTIDYPRVGKRPFLLLFDPKDELTPQQDFVKQRPDWTHVEYTLRRTGGKDNPEVFLECNLENKNGWWKCHLRYAEGTLKGMIVWVYTQKGSVTGNTKVDLKIKLDDLLPKGTEGPLAFDVPAETTLELRNLKILPNPKTD